MSIPGKNKPVNISEIIDFDRLLRLTENDLEGRILVNRAISKYTTERVLIAMKTMSQDVYPR